MGKSGGVLSPRSFTSPSSFRLITAAFEKFEQPWDVQAGMLVLLCLPNVFQVLFRAPKKFFKNTTQRSAPRLNSHGWRGTWEKTGRYLEDFSPPMVWNFTPKQLQDPGEAIECWKGKYGACSREAQLTALCGIYQYPHQYLPTTARYYAAPSGGREGKQTDRRCSYSNPRDKHCSYPNQPRRQALQLNQRTNLCRCQSPLCRKRNTRRNRFNLARDGGEPGSSREQEEEAEPEIITRSLSLSELQDTQKDFGRQPGEHIVTRLLRCWGNGPVAWN